MKGGAATTTASSDVDVDMMGRRVKDKCTRGVPRAPQWLGERAAHSTCIRQDTSARRVPLNMRASSPDGTI